MMRIMTKIHLKHEQVRARREGNQERLALLTAVLNDDDLVQVIHEANQAEYDYVRDTRKTSAVYGGAFQDFLKWLFENREQILKLILSLVQLFAILEPPPAKPER